MNFSYTNLRVHPLLIVVVVFYFLIPTESRSLAQIGTANVTGTVVDVTTARIPGAAVKLLNVATGTENDSSTNASGVFFLAGVLPGDYTLEIDRNGFAPLQVNGLTLHVGDTKSFLVRLRVGAIAQTIDVGEVGNMLDAGDISVNTVVDKDFVSSTPLNGRSFQDLFEMTPGIVTQSPQTATQSFGARGSFSVNGQNVDTNSYLVDGVSANVGASLLTGHQKTPSDGSIAGLTALGTTQSLLSVDALQEFRVLTSTYSAEYGRSLGGQFILSTRSGTNEMHGSVYDYVRSDAVDALDWYSHFDRTVSRTAYHQDDFGGTFSAPVVLPKLYDGRNKTFLFASYEGLNVEQPSAPQVLFDPTYPFIQSVPMPLRNVLELFPPYGINGLDFPSADSTGLYPYVQSVTSYPGIVNAASIRLDDRISSRISGFFRYGESPSNSDAGQLSSLTHVNVEARTITAGVSAQFAARTSNDLRIGYAATHSSLQTTLDNYDSTLFLHLGTSLNPAIGIPASFASASADAFIDIPGAGTSEIYTDQASSRLQEWNLRDTFSMQAGQHLVRLGIDQRHVNSEVTPPAITVEADFVTTESLLQNLASYVSITRNSPGNPVFEQLGAFVEDDWRTSKSLTFSAGLRWEFEPAPHGENGVDAYTVTGSLEAPSSLLLASRGTPLWHADKVGFAPRFGGVWAPSRSSGHEFLIRGGVGVFFSTAGQAGAEAFDALGFSATNYFESVSVPVTESQLAFATSVEAPYVDSPVYAFPQHLQLPYALQWNIAIESALGKSQTLNVTWVGTNGSRLLQDQSRDIHDLNPAFGEVDFFPGGITSNYEGLQAKFQRNLSHGFQVLGDYAWAHALDYGSTAPQFPLIRGNSDLDVRQNLQLAASWTETPEPLHGIRRALLGGWGVDGRLNARTAYPITLQGKLSFDAATGNRYHSGVELLPNRPVYLYGSQYPGGRMINGGPEARNSAFSLPVGDEPGNAPRNSLRGFGASQVNFSVRREFSFGAKLKLQLRLDTFNLFNHPEFGYIDPALTDALFGQATFMLNQSFGSTGSLYEPGGPRSIQGSFRLHF